MALRIRFEFIEARHRPETKQHRAASMHWRGRAVNGAVKKHIGCVTEPVEPRAVEPFLMTAKKVLVELGGSEPEVNLALTSAKDFLHAHLRQAPAPPPPRDARAREWARAAIQRLSSLHRGPPERGARAKPPSLSRVGRR